MKQPRHKQGGKAGSQRRIRPITLNVRFQPLISPPPPPRRSPSRTPPPSGGANFSTFKNALVDLSVAKLSPITAEMRRIKEDESYIDAVLREGSERARTLARANMDAVKDIVGFLR